MSRNPEGDDGQPRRFSAGEKREEAGASRWSEKVAGARGRLYLKTMRRDEEHPVRWALSLHRSLPIKRLPGWHVCRRRPWEERAREEAVLLQPWEDRPW